MKGRLNKNAAGFTLLELLVALAIFGIMSVMAYSGLAAMLDSKKHIEKETTKLTRLQKTFALMQRDFSQFARRDIRDEYGEKQPALQWQEASDTGIEFTCGGRYNPGSQSRSSLQRVAYNYTGGRLLRLNWPALDRTAEAKSSSQVLLEQVDGFFIEYLTRDGDWVLPQTTEDLPVGIRISLDINGWGRITRLFSFAVN